MNRLGLIAVVALSLFCWRCSDDGAARPDGLARLDSTVGGGDGKPTPAPDGKPTPTPDGKPTPAPDGKPTPAPDGKPTPAPDGKPTPKPDGPPATGQLGSVCTQQNKSCGSGLKCIFLEAWNAPKGTCERVLPDACKSWDDARCADATYGAMCGPYTEGSTTVNMCFLVCELNGKTYPCPPLHGCKLINGFKVCVPQ